MAIPARRVAQIKTLAAIRGSGAHSNEPHAHHFQIASLELEKSRHIRERASALRRVAAIDARIAEIEASVQKHNQALGVTDASRATPVPSSKVAASEKRRTLRY